MPTQTGQCAECRALNSHAVHTCIECGKPLTWAERGGSAMKSADSESAISNNAPLLVATCKHGSLELWPEKIVIRHNGTNSLFHHEAQSIAHIPLETLTDIHFKPAGALSPGHIHFEFMRGAHSHAATPPTGVMILEENTMRFQHQREAEFERFHKAVQNQKAILRQRATQIEIKRGL